jgi:hypothetical protein
MLDVGCWENWRVVDDCFEQCKTISNFSNHIKPFKQYQTNSNNFKQCQTMSNYNFKFFLNFLSVSALRPDLSGNPFYKKRWEMFWVL